MGKRAPVAGSRRYPPSNFLLKALKQSIFSGNSFVDFRARMIICVAAAAILLCLPTLMVDLLNGNFELVLITGLGGLAMIIAVGAASLYRRVDMAVNLVLITLTTMMAALLIVRQGETLGFYVGVPAIIFLASLLASKAVAVFYWLACTALFAVAAYLGHTKWATVIDMSDPIIAIGGMRIGLIILFFNLLTVVLFRDSIRDLFLDRKAKTDEIARVNQSLAQVIEDKQAWIQVLEHIHDAGLAIAWYYDTKTGQLKYTDHGAVGEPKPVLATMDNLQLQNMDEQSWQTKIYQAIVTAGSSTQGWAREIRCINPVTGDQRWYAVTAETHFLDSGVQIVGALCDITGNKSLGSK